MDDESREYDPQAVKLVYDLLGLLDDADGWVEVPSREYENHRDETQKAAAVYLEANGCYLAFPYGPVTREVYEYQRMSEQLLSFYQPPQVAID